MNITREVITDLLPLYYSGDCSPDTRRLITEFLASDPEFARKLRTAEQQPLPSGIPQQLKREDELTTLGRTQRLLRFRSSIMGLAIFFTLVPFSFVYTNGKVYWLFQESPTSVAVYGILGVVCWVVYALLRMRTRTF